LYAHREAAADLALEHEHQMGDWHITSAGYCYAYCEHCEAEIWATLHQYGGEATEEACTGPEINDPWHGMTQADFISE
jgi:hypothetical protein